MPASPRSRTMRTLVPLVALAAVASGCGGGGSSSPGSPSSAATRSGGTFRMGIVEPTAIDPYNSQESEGSLVTKNVFTQLVDLDKDDKLVPAAATDWSADADCTSWTFHLVKGATFSNGEPVAAQSFIEGMTRAARQDAASDVAYHMAGITGFDELNGGSATTFSGLSAPDPDTLRVALSAPDCEFDKKTLQTVFSPVPKDAGPASNKAFNDQPVGNGPFKLDGPWLHDTSISLVRNDAYFGARAHLDRVQLTILNPDNANTLEYNGIKGGQFDYARIPPPLLGQAKAQFQPRGGFLDEVKYGINYLATADATPPLNSPDARKAISYAIDRDAIIAGVFKGFQTKATSFLPPAFKGYYQQGVCQSCVKQDVGRAKELAASAGLTPGTPVDLMFNTGGGHEEWIQAVAAQLHDVLGLQVNVNGVPFKELLQNLSAPTFSGLSRLAWGADYPTPDDFLFPNLSTAAINPNAQGVVTGNNYGRYSNPAFDALLDEERAAKTEAQRVPVVQQAEKLAIGDDLALIPLWYRTQYRVFDADAWTGVDMDFFENPTLSVISRR